MELSNISLPTGVGVSILGDYFPRSSSFGVDLNSGFVAGVVRHLPVVIPDGFSFLRVGDVVIWRQGSTLSLDLPNVGRLDILDFGGIICVDSGYSFES